MEEEKLLVQKRLNILFIKKESKGLSSLVAGLNQHLMGLCCMETSTLQRSLFYGSPGSGSGLFQTGFADPDL